jgi:DNA-binding transcriptional ArsR family regulator
MPQTSRLRDTDRASPGEVTQRRSQSEQAVESLASMLRVLADPTRIRLIEALEATGGATAGSLAEVVPGTRQAISHHLGILHRAAIVSSRREGRFVRYELCDWTGAWVIRGLAAGLLDES